MMTPEELKAFRINNLAEGRKKKKQSVNQPEQPQELQEQKYYPYKRLMPQGQF